MARIYSEEEKRTHLDKYKVCGKTKTEYAKMICQKVDSEVDSMHDKTIWINMNTYILEFEKIWNLFLTIDKNKCFL